MSDHRVSSIAGVGNQRGTTLIVVLVLILLATVMGLFAVNVNLSEQRTSGNDVKVRLMRQSAELALAQGMEYTKSLKPTDRDPFATATVWTRCLRSDTSFPCGTVPVCSDGTTTCPTSCPATGTTGACPRRETMFYYTGSTFDINGDGSVDAIEARMLPLFNPASPSTSRLPQITTSGNGFTVNYGVGAVLCVLARPGLVGTTSTTVQCATDKASASGTTAISLVAVGSIPGESAHTTLTQTVGSYDRINNPPGKPPVVASGTVDLTGTLQVVTNPNAAGPGVPISVWTRGAVSKTGTSNSCYYDEFIRDGQKGSVTATVEPALNADSSQGPIVTPSDQILRCDACNCIGPDSLSFQSSGNTGQLGIDVLQCSTGPATPCDGTQRANAGANYDIKPNEFPCDLFQFVFGVSAWRDTNGDNFCETKITTSATIKGVTYPTMPADEAFLYANADKIIPTSGNAAKVTSQQLATCSDLNANAFGLIWDQTGCGVGSNNTVGSVLYPVLLVSDGATTVQGALFGLLFVRSTGSTLDPSTGGDATLRMNSGAALYGSMIVQGTILKANGTSTVVYSDKVLGNLGKNSIPPAWGSVPGSWSDRFSY